MKERTKATATTGRRRRYSQPRKADDGGDRESIDIEPAKHAVDRIGEMLRQGKLKNIVGIPTSTKTHEQAVSLGIPLSDLNEHPVVDLAIDGADEVDQHLNLVKGRGGSLLREKMVEGACKKFVVIVDETKLVEYLGGSGLAMPVEIIPFVGSNR